ncbi:hypothetical protein D3C78_1176330 [compost metagenome]
MRWSCRRWTRALPPTATRSTSWAGCRQKPKPSACSHPKRRCARPWSRRVRSWRICSSRRSRRVPTRRGRCSCSRAWTCWASNCCTSSSRRRPWRSAPRPRSRPSRRWPWRSSSNRRQRSSSPPHAGATTRPSSTGRGRSRPRTGAKRTAAGRKRRRRSSIGRTAAARPSGCWNKGSSSRSSCRGWAWSRPISRPCAAASRPGRKPRCGATPPPPAWSSRWSRAGPCPGAMRPAAKAPWPEAAASGWTRPRRWTGRAWAA